MVQQHGPAGVVQGQAREPDPVGDIPGTDRVLLESIKFIHPLNLGTDRELLESAPTGRRADLHMYHRSGRSGLKPCPSPPKWTCATPAAAALSAGEGSDASPACLVLTSRANAGSPPVRDEGMYSNPSIPARTGRGICKEPVLTGQPVGIIAIYKV